MRRIKTPQSLGRDYKQMLKDYFGKFLYGLDVKNKGGHVQAQVVYFDFKHIDTVRKELAQMMPEVEFIRLKRDFTTTAMTWLLGQTLSPDYRNKPVIYVKRGDDIIKTDMVDLAQSELCQMELEEGDIDYPEASDLDLCLMDDETMRQHSWD
ncbi:MAG: hypothetical protein IKQ37_00075 [Bacteroidaceae bacterium]|nr:hypothetical protein [Bacteroidaceae bacterium]